MIDQPRFVSVEQADDWLSPREPVVLLAEGNAAKTYSLQILIWHEMVNDVVGGRPVAVRYCPLCNTALAFDRRLDGKLLDFGTTGRLRHSDLVMYDRQTESWWREAPGSVSVDDNFFDPKASRQDGQATVMWNWTGRNLHNVTFDVGGSNWATQRSGSSSRTFTEPRDFTYICTARSGTADPDKPVGM